MPHRNFAFAQRSVDVSHFSMVPRADVPRSVFQVESTHKTTFDTGLLIPVYLEEVLPGDSFKVNMTAFARVSTPLYPIMDNLHMDSFFFFVPNRLLWDNWQRFMGEQDKPTDSISFLIPTAQGLTPGYGVGTLQDYMGLPPLKYPIVYNALPFRAYYLIWNEWFRDENLQDSLTVPRGDTDTGDYNLQRRGKRHDYFTSCLPWAQKGAAVTIPLGTQAPVKGIGTISTPWHTVGGPQGVTETSGATVFYPQWGSIGGIAFGSSPQPQFAIRGPDSGSASAPQIYADLSQATASTINALRQAFQVQKLLERDARGGTRYTEILRSHFGVTSPDMRLQRPEYLGGGTSPVNVSPVAQTAPTASADGTTIYKPLGALGAVGTSVAQHGFSHSFTEHGYILGLVSVRADLTYQQGLHKLWTRSTRYDFYWPVFAHLGEQVVYRREIYFTGLNDAANDLAVFGYQERWSEYRHKPSRITGSFRSGITGTMDSWHLAQNFTAPPVLGPTFIQDTPPMARVLAAGALANGQQILFDSVFQERRVRAMPAYSVPGFIDRF